VLIGIASTMLPHVITTSGSTVAVAFLLLSTLSLALVVWLLQTKETSLNH